MKTCKACNKQFEELDLDKDENLCAACFQEQIKPYLWGTKKAFNEINKLKKALKEAILTKNKVTKEVVDFDPGSGSTYQIEWTKQIQEWAKLCDLDLSKHNPEYFLEK